jgi:hypothetical protein
MYVKTDPNTIKCSFGYVYVRSDEVEKFLTPLFGEVEAYVPEDADVGYRVRNSELLIDGAILMLRGDILVYMSGIRTEEMVIKPVKLTHKRARKNDKESK